MAAIADIQVIYQVLIVLGPLGLLAVGLWPSRRANQSPKPYTRAVVSASYAAALMALLATLMLIFGEPLNVVFLKLATINSVPLSLSIHFDAISAAMLLLVSMVGSIVCRYSRNYLDGDANQGRFMKWLALTLGAALVLMIAGNVILLAAAWIGMSLALHQLLVLYGERRGAQLAARKKFILGRIGDVALLTALALLIKSTGSAELSVIFDVAARARETGAIFEHATAITLLLVFAAVIKSAQFPFHGWLPEVMETPTPVSALLHAGIINAGGFLIIRMSEVMALNEAALLSLAVVGAATALFGSLVMLTQNSIKVSLAYSTVAQMGFMLLQCGLGAFSAALLHIVAHSLYKAHAFLSSGSVVDITRASWVPQAHQHERLPLDAGIALLLAVIVCAAGGYAIHTGLLGLSVGILVQPGMFALTTILVMTIVFLVWRAADEHRGTPVVARGLALGIAVGVAYFVLQWLFANLFSSSLPDTTASGLAASNTLANWLVAAAVVALFMAVLLLQAIVPYRLDSPTWRRWYVHLANGLYVNAWTDRLLQSNTRPAIRH